MRAFIASMGRRSRHIVAGELYGPGPYGERSLESDSTSAVTGFGENAVARW
jgi:hypothetical protein